MTFSAAWPLVLDFFGPKSMAEPTMAGRVEEHDWNLAQMLATHRGRPATTRSYCEYMACVSFISSRFRV